MVTECLRVARKAVVLVEPIYELASTEAQARMRHHGYVRRLREAAEALDCEIEDYRLLECRESIKPKRCFENQQARASIRC